jgi:hypothetical protein
MNMFYLILQNALLSKSQLSTLNFLSLITRKTMADSDARYVRIGCVESVSASREEEREEEREDYEREDYEREDYEREDYEIELRATLLAAGCWLLAPGSWLLAVDIVVLGPPHGHMFVRVGVRTMTRETDSTSLLYFACARRKN